MTKPFNKPILFCVFHSQPNYLVVSYLKNAIHPYVVIYINMFYFSLGNSDINLLFLKISKNTYSLSVENSLSNKDRMGEQFCSDSFSLGTFFVLVEERALLIFAVVICEFLLHSITYLFSELLTV